MAETIMITENVMRKISITKVTLNIGAGKNQDRLEKGLKLLEALSGVKPVKTVTQKRIAGWGLRPGLPIGCKVTVRGERAHALLKTLLTAKDNQLKEEQFDDYGNIAFGIPEYIDIEGAEYDPEIGIIGLQICVTLERPGYRLKRRRLKKRKTHKTHLITKEDAIQFMKTQFNITMGEEE